MPPFTGAFGIPQEIAEDLKQNTEIQNIHVPNLLLVCSQCKICSNSKSCMILAGMGEHESRTLPKHLKESLSNAIASFYLSFN